MEIGIFYGDFMVKLSSLEIVWGFHEENVVNQFTRQSPH